MENFKTCELVEELKKREAVKHIEVEPYVDFKILVSNNEQPIEVNNGPVQIFVIWD
jgi:hypothetical protein